MLDSRLSMLDQRCKLLTVLQKTCIEATTYTLSVADSSHFYVGGEVTGEYGLELESASA